MVAVIKTVPSINPILNYNENKLKEDKAECISGANYQRKRYIGWRQSRRPAVTK